MSNFTYSDELYHHGILGMKWGIRRFQNEDGTRTEAGKRRYAKLNERVDRIYERRTKDLKKIVDDPETYKNKYNRDRAQLAIDKETKLRDIRKAEIEEGYDYLENEFAKSTFVTWLIGGLPLSTINTGISLFADNDEWKARSEVNKQYKEDAKKLKEENIKNTRTNEQMDFYKNRLYGKGEDIEKMAEPGNSKNGFTKEQKRHNMSLAENEGRYNVDFLEAIQNSEIFDKDDVASMNKEYKKFLDDPEDYLTNGSRRLKQV